MAYRKITFLPYVPFYVLMLPALIMGGHVVQATYSTSFYYGPFVGNLFYIAFDPVSIALYALAGFIVTKLLHYARTFKKPWKIASYVGLTVMLGLAAAYCFLALMVLPLHYHISDDYCESPLISNLQRCEGLTKTFLQDRMSGVARYGDAIPNVQTALDKYPAYNLYQLPCDELQGDMGQTCFIGQDQREKGDTDYMALYIKGSKILVLETENIPPLKEGADKRGPFSEFVDLSRFHKDME